VTSCRKAASTQRPWRLAGDDVRDPIAWDGPCRQRGDGTRDLLAAYRGRFDGIGVVLRVRADSAQIDHRQAVGDGGAQDGVVEEGQRGGDQALVCEVGEVAERTPVNGQQGEP
jgi:hypothetical protein